MARVRRPPVSQRACGLLEEAPFYRHVLIASVGVAAVRHGLNFGEKKTAMETGNLIKYNLINYSSGMTIVSYHNL